MNEEETQETPDTGISVITIVLNEDNWGPEIDLGDIPPIIAITIFQKALEILEEFVPSPKISYMGNTIFSDEMFEYPFEDDDD